MSREAAHERGVLGSRLELLEPHRQPVSIRPVLAARWEIDAIRVQPLQRLRRRPVPLAQDLLGNVDAEIWIDADQMRVERGVMRLRKRNEPLVPVLDDVRCVEEQRLAGKKPLATETALRVWTGL